MLEENNLASIAFPCIATGVYGYDKERGANVALGTVRRYLEKSDKVSVLPRRSMYHCRCAHRLEFTFQIDKVIFCLFNDKDKAIYKGKLFIDIRVDTVLSHSLT